MGTSGIENGSPRARLTPGRACFQENVAPLFEVHMELDEDGLVFNPSMEIGTDHSFLALVESLINDIYNVAKLIPRLDKSRLNYKVSQASFGPACSPTWAPIAFLVGSGLPHSAVPGYLH